MKTNKWTKPIDELIKVFGTAEKLADAVTKALGEKAEPVTSLKIGRIRRGVTTIVDYDVGQAILILHVKYVPQHEKADE